MKKRTTSRKVGFTLIEMMVIIMIVGIFSALLLANYRGSQENSQLSGLGQTIAIGVREAQHKAMASQTVRGEVPCGYGLHIDSNGSFFIFASQGEETDCSDDDKEYNIGEEIGLATDLPQGVSVITALPLDIFFSPPDPFTYFNGELGDEQKITLARGWQRKNIIINSFGLIEIE